MDDCVNIYPTTPSHRDDKLDEDVLEKPQSLKGELEEAREEAELWKIKCLETSKNAEMEKKNKDHRSTHHVTNGRNNSMHSWTRTSFDKDDGEPWEM
jgi:hypothetical protein